MVGMGVVYDFESELILMNVQTFPVYSKLVDPTIYPAAVAAQLPVGWRLSEHQLATYEALHSGQYDVVINTAMTGDGKSLAAYLPTLLNKTPMMGMYPTKELARDQEWQLRREKQMWHSPLQVGNLSADVLDGLVAANTHQRRGSALEDLLKNNPIVLTNPDIFHYITQFHYTVQGQAPDAVIGRALLNGFNQFVFDEFHIFQTPQIVAVVNALLLLRELTRNQPKRYLFLSATPDAQLMGYLEKAQMRVKLVEGAYRQESHDVPDLNAWRPIIRATHIQLAQGGVEEWLANHLESDLLPFFRQHAPAAKGAIIFNSVAAAYRVAARLKPILAQMGLTAELNTGLSSQALKQASRECDLLIGTSTVDVGVDFRINFLLFESQDAGTFLQRLGRLGRHADDGRGHPFDTFQAIALVPNFIYERLQKEGWGDGGEYSRHQLAQDIRSVYRPPAEFPRYMAKWGWVQACHTYGKLAHATIRDNYMVERQNLKQQLWHTFRINVQQQRSAFKDLAPKLREEAQSFRGSSPFSCGILDVTEATPTVKTYNLLSLLASGRLTWLGHEAFEQECHKLKTAIPRSQELAGWFRFEGFNQERRPWEFHIRQRLFDTAADRWGVAVVQKNISLQVEGVDWLNSLNRHLERREFVATLCQTPPAELRYSKLYLPPFFQLYPFRAADGCQGSITFGGQALLLHVALEQAQISCGGSAIFL